MKIYRDWQLSGDDEFLQKNWGQVKKVLAYAWTDKGWDGNQDGVMEGLQHNTMDVNYFGPNPQMGFWYMGALKAAEKMALAMKDKTFAKKCNTLFRQGSTWMDAAAEFPFAASDKGKEARKFISPFSFVT